MNHQNTFIRRTPTRESRSHVYVFDLDDVLLPTSTLFSQPAVRDWIESHALTQDMNQTLAGYQQVVHPNPRLIQQLGQLRGHKYILTNASRTHAHAATHALGIARFIVGQIDATHGLELKPHYEPYENMTRFVHSVQKHRPEQVYRIVFFDDRVENHVVPKQLGWTTVWIYGALPNQERGRHMHCTPHHIDMSFETVEQALGYFAATQDSPPHSLPLHH